MNDFLFRAWIEAEQKYFYFSIYNTIPFESNLIEQSIGVKDLDDKLLYCGDIVQIIATFDNREYFFYGIIQWNQERGCFTCEDWRLDQLLADPVYSFKLMGSHKENPQLLTKFCIEDK